MLGNKNWVMLWLNTCLIYGTKAIYALNAYALVSAVTNTTALLVCLNTKTQVN